MEIKTTIGNKGFLMYKKYRCLYKHISNSIRDILKWFAAFESIFRAIFHDMKNCQ